MTNISKGNVIDPRLEAWKSCPREITIHFSGHPLVVEYADPAELFQFHRKSHVELTSTQRLMRAVVFDAADQFLYRWKYPGHSPRALHRESEAWFDDDYSVSQFSFGTICDVFKWHPKYITRMLGDHLEKYGPEATDLIFQPLIECFGMFTRRDVDRAVARSYGMETIQKSSRRVWQPKYIYFRMLAVVFCMDDQALREECRALGWKSDSYFYERMTTAPLPHDKCRAVVAELQQLAADRAGVSNARAQ